MATATSTAKRGRTRYVYQLSDPRNGAVKYVGCAIDPQQRLNAHLRRSHNRRVREWIAELRKSGSRPTMTILGDTGGVWWHEEIEGAAIEADIERHRGFVANHVRHSMSLQRRRAIYRWKYCRPTIKHHTRNWAYVLGQAKRVMTGRCITCDREN